MAQMALHRGPGKYRQLLAFTGDVAAARAAAVTLLSQVEAEIPRQGTLQVLVAVSHDVLPRGVGGALSEADAKAVAELRSEIKLLVQVSAENPDQLTFGKRLVKFALHTAGLVKLDELSGVRHLQARENFGYRDEPAASYHVPEPQEGLPWLLYVRCPQNLRSFSKHGTAERETAKLEHVAAMKAITSRAGVLRRSFDYETYDEAGLAFLASAASAEPLAALVHAFKKEKDDLASSVQRALPSSGLLVVPPSAAWLDATLAAKPRRPLPQWVLDFRRNHDYLEYEVTPSTFRFMREAFRMNAGNLREDGELRPDLKLILRGMIKLLLGYRIDANSPLTGEYLDKLFGPKSGVGPTPAPQARPRQLVDATLADLESERLEADQRSPVLNSRLFDLFELALTGSREAEAINEEAGEYITFSI
ncbi:MAG: hypothetical protein QM756_34645 [Polyangiaceae bacterium]